MKINGSKTNLCIIALAAWKIFHALNVSNQWLVISSEVDEIVTTLILGGGAASMRHAIQKTEDKIETKQ